jgi:DNA repair protein RadC
MQRSDKRQPYHNRRIQDMVLSERPQERLEKHGAQALSDRELLALILRSGQKGVDIISLTGELLDQAGSLAKLMYWNRADFLQVHGIGAVKAAQLLTVMELARRIMECWDTASTEGIYDHPERVAQHFRARTAGLAVEKCWVLTLDRKNRLIRDIECSSGTATSSLVHPREVFREAIKQSASGIILVHNHPSGDPAPSRADLQVTRQVREAAQTIQIELLDHVILGHKPKDPLGLGYYSFHDAGLL